MAENTAEAGRRLAETDLLHRLQTQDLPLERLYRWEREHPAQVFLTQPFGGGQTREWTWAQAADQVRRMAAYLKAQNWAPGSRIGILSKNCAWWILADLATWMSGHVSVPIYPSLKPHSVRQILEHSEAVCCFVGATDEKEMTEGVPSGVLSIAFPTAAVEAASTWEKVVSETLPVAGQPVRGPDELATIIYTSGTTGIPKGVMHSFAAFTYNAATLISMLHLTPDQRILSYLPLAHIVERIGVEWMSLVLGSRIFFAEGLDTFLADLHRAAPTIFLSVPRLLLKFQQNVFARVPKERLDRLFRIPIVGRLTKRKILRQLGLATAKHAACGAAPLPVEILLWYRDLGLNLAEGYGLTETLITHLPPDGAVRPGYVGPAIPGVEAELGDGGEVLLRSPMNLLGYYKDREATTAAFTGEGYFRTGDIGVIEPDGQLKIIGRLKEQFKTSKGKYVAPAPIESRLVSHPAVEACCLMGAGMPHPFAIAILSEDVRRQCKDSEARARLEDSLREQMNALNAQLDPHERVAFLVIADGPWTIGNGLMTPTLKLKRPILEQRYRAFIEAWQKQGQMVLWETAP